MSDLAAQLAPTGKLRVAIAIAPAPSAQFAIKDEAGHYRGVAVILGTALAKKLGVPVELVVYNGSGEVQNSAAQGKWDVAFMPVDEERKKFVDFGNDYHILQSTYLVAPAAKNATVAAANTSCPGGGKCSATLPGVCERPPITVGSFNIDATGNPA